MYVCMYIYSRGFKGESWYSLQLKRTHDDQVFLGEAHAMIGNFQEAGKVQSLTLLLLLLYILRG